LVKNNQQKKQFNDRLSLDKDNRIYEIYNLHKRLKKDMTREEKIKTLAQIGKLEHSNCSFG